MECGIRNAECGMEATGMWDVDRGRRNVPPFRLPRSAFRIRFALGLASLILLSSVRAQDASPSLAIKVKAALLVEFARYTTWPAERLKGDGPVVIGVIADDELAGVLAELVKREAPKVRGRAVEVRKLPRIDPADKDDVKRFTKQAAELHVLYMGEAGGQRPRDLLRLLGGIPVLTVSQTSRFAEDGGMIELSLPQKSYRFDINNRSVTQAGLNVSAKMLELARKVIRE